MMLDISSLLQDGWKNIWKNKILWVFSVLTLIEPLIRLVFPIQKSVDLLSALFNIIMGFAPFYFRVISFAGVSYINYCIAIDKEVNFQTAYQASKTLFWRIVTLIFVLFLFSAPCYFTVFIISYKEPFQIVDFTHNFFFTLIPLSIFDAMWYFVITETIANGSKIGKSLKTAWTVFTYNFASLAIIGALLVIVFYIMNISIGVIIMLTQTSFDFTSLSKLDFISPYLSFPNNNFYKLASAVAQTIWHTYSTSVFTIAYLKYGGAKQEKLGKPVHTTKKKT